MKIIQITTPEEYEKEQLDNTTQAIKTVESWTEGLKALRKKKQKLVALWKIFKWTFIITALLGFAALIKVFLGVII